MPRLPRLTAKRLADTLRRAPDLWRSPAKGATGSTGGRTRTGRITVPIHSGMTLKAGTVKSILEQAGLTVEELRRLL